MRNLFLLLILIVGVSLKAQNKRQQVEEKVKSLKVAFITNKLEFTPGEAEKFWPIFNQYEEEKEALSKDKKTDNEDFKNESEANTYISKYFETREKELALEKKYIEKFKTVLPVTKVAKLLIYEKKFRKEVMSNVIEKKRRHH